jgi:DNA repair exonuclease SbcCD ATPase subunit
MATAKKVEKLEEDITNKIELKKFTVNSFMGIDKSKPVILDFTRFRKAKTITILEGNQGVGKSSTINAFLYALGLELDFKKENIINLSDGTVSVDFEFNHGDERYIVHATKSKFEVKMYNEKVNLWLGVGEPKEFLKKIFGVVATDPTAIKNMTGKKQIEWLRKTFSKEHDGAGRKPKEEMLLDELEERSDARTDANREMTRIQHALEQNELYINREQNHKRFEKPVTIDAAKARLNEAAAAKSKFDTASNTLQSLKERKISQEERIKELEMQLVEAQNSLNETNRSIDEGEEWVTANKHIEKEFATAQEEFTNINTEALAYQNWLRVLEDEKIMDEYATTIITLDGRKDEIKKELLQLTKKYVPKMPGLEVMIKTGIDDDKEGLYYNGKTMAQSSESEFWTVYLAIAEHNDVNFVVLENISSLGSGAIDVLNELAAKGVYILASEQNRKMNTMKISYHEQID